MVARLSQSVGRSLPSILLTGGTGYIASHTAVALARAGFTPVLLDNLSNSKLGVLSRIECLLKQPLPFFRLDVRDTASVREVIESHRVAAVIHFAALKALGESVAQPLRYFQNNVGGLTSLLEAMQMAGCRRLVFSSSAVVYGEPKAVPIRETDETGFTNPYAQTKLMGEQILAALQSAEPNWQVGVLRYFNPVGADESGLIGEDPSGIPNNLFPYVAQVAVGRRPHLRVYGNDYPTRDGTGVRDYIHVSDLASGHVASVEALLDGRSHCVNLGTGRGYSVLEVVNAYRVASGKTIPIEIVARRPGDIAEAYTDPSLSERVLGWRASRSLEEMCESSWKFQKMNPSGYLGE